MSMYRVSLRQIVEGVMKQTRDFDVEAEDPDHAANTALGHMVGVGWISVGAELLSNPDSNPDAQKLMDLASELADEIKTRQRLERKLAEQIRINDKTAANCHKARKRRKAAEKQLEYLQEQEENLRDWIKDDQAKLKAKQEELNHLKEMYADIHGKHNNLVEKSAAIDIENQKLHSEIQEHERNREELLIERTKLRELVDVQREALAKFENTAQVDSHAIQRLQQQRTDDENRIKNLAEERDSILSKNRDLVKENVDAKEMIRKQAQQIDDLVHERPRQRTSQPSKPVEALVREQDTDARLWANSFANRFDVPEELDAEITGWFANAIETAKDSVRNKPKGARQYPEKPLPDFDMPKAMRDLLPEIPKPEGWEDPFQYAKRLQAVLQEFIDGMMKKLQPVLDTVGPIVAEVEKEYPGWMASNYQTKEEWWGTQTTKEKTKPVDPEFKDLFEKVIGVDINSGKPVGEKADAYEFVNAPKHYNDHPSGVECQVIIRECKDPLIAIAFKHLWRTQWGNKPGQTVDQDLGKAVEYIQLEQARRAGKDRL